MIRKSIVVIVLLCCVQALTVYDHSLLFAGHKGPKAPPPTAITGNEPVTPFSGVSLAAPYSIGPGDSIGFSRYDFLSNGSSTRNLVSYGDGIISLGRMGAIIPAHADRGTWYGCSADDGTSWPPLLKIEAVRTGWGTIAQIADANGTCVSLAHDAAATFLNASTDADRCAGGWSGGNTTIPGFWPRVAVGSGVDVHVLYANANPPTSVFYSHSPDGGATWDNTNVNIFTLAGNVIFADTYNLAAQGTNVAAVSAGYALNGPGVTGSGDVILATSTDAGVTWSEQYVYDIDNTNFTEQDVPDGASAVGFDPAGNIHVVWSNFYTPGDGSTYFSIDAGIYHWSEATGAHEIILPLQDTVIVPPTTGREGNYASAPSLGFDADGNMFVVYSQFINEKDVNLVYYEHVYAAGSRDGGVTWSEGVDITPGTGFDAAFPSLAENVGDNLEFVYWSDNLAGNAIRLAHAEQDVAVMYHEADKTTVLPADPNVFMDDFEAYTAGVQLVSQNNVDWDTWSSLPGSTEDPVVSNAHANSGANSVLILTPNDLIRLHGSRTTGSWGISFQVYIPAGKQGYFNTMSGFTPNPLYWGMEVHFEPAGVGRLVSDVPVTSFTWLEDTWQLVEVIVDLDQDLAQFVLDGAVIRQWQWTTGASGGTGPLQLDANDFYGATANDEMYFDDYNFMADTLRSTVDVSDPTASIPVEYDLVQNYPNPFNPSTRIAYALPEQASVTLRIYNLLGQEVITLADKVQEAGQYEVVWNARNKDGQSVGTGVYFYRFEARGTSGEVYTSFKKMMFLK